MGTGTGSYGDLVTHEKKPWIFWVDGDSKLWAQHWDDDTTKQELATGVTYVRAIRAWKNLNIGRSDQGIVVRIYQVRW